MVSEKEKYYMEIYPGLTTTQAKQLAFLDKVQPLESLAYLRPYWVSCKECKESKTYYTAESARDFILRHKGHSTWLIVGRKTDALLLSIASIIGAGITIYLFHKSRK